MIPLIIIGIIVFYVVLAVLRWLAGPVRDLNVIERSYTRIPPKPGQGKRRKISRPRR